MIVKNLAKRTLVFNYSKGKVILKPGDNKVREPLFSLMEKDNIFQFFIKENQIEIPKLNISGATESFDKDSDGIIDSKDISASDLIEQIKTMDDMEALEDIKTKDSRKSVQKAVKKQISLLNDMKGE